MSGAPSGLLAQGSQAGYCPVVASPRVMLTSAILFSRPSNDPEKMWVNCQREGGDPFEISLVKIRVEKRVKLSGKVQPTCVCALTCGVQAGEEKACDSLVSWELNSLSCSYFVSLTKSQAAAAQ